jgi:hypothetical protein
MKLSIRDYKRKGNGDVLNVIEVQHCLGSNPVECMNICEGNLTL